MTFITTVGEFINFLQKNRYIDWAVLMLLFSSFISFTNLPVTNILLNITMGLVFVFIMAAMLEELFFRKNKQVYRYKNAAKLLILTKKIEKELERLGGSGKGMYEKASSLGQRISPEMLERILILAEIRNNAVHTNPQIENTQTVLHEAYTLLKELQALYKSHYKYDKHIFALKIAFITLFSFILARKSYLEIGLGATIFTLFLYFYLVKFFFSHRFTRKQILISSVIFLLMNGLLYYVRGYTSIEAYLSESLRFIIAFLY